MGDCLCRGPEVLVRCLIFSKLRFSTSPHTRGRLRCSDELDNVLCAGVAEPFYCEDSMLIVSAENSQADRANDLHPVCRYQIPYRPPQHSRPAVTTNLVTCHLWPPFADGTSSAGSCFGARDRCSRGIFARLSDRRPQRSLERDTKVSLCF